MKNKIQLYSYYRSSCSYRVRVALYLKNIPFEYIPVHLLKNGGEQKKDSYKRLNPEGMVPSLVCNNQVITQSLAILQYLEDMYPSPSLFPKEPLQKAQAISICEMINSNIQPLHNLKTLQWLKSRGRMRGLDIKDWLGFWIQEGLLSVEKKVKKNKQSLFAVGRSLTVADLFIVPQLYSARRFNVNLKDCSRLLAIEELCQRLSAFKKAHPGAQPDSPLFSA